MFNKFNELNSGVKISIIVVGLILICGICLTFIVIINLVMNPRPVQLNKTELTDQTTIQNPDEVRSQDDQIQELPDESTILITDLIGKQMNELSTQFNTQLNNSNDLSIDNEFYKISIEHYTELVMENGIYKPLERDYSGFVNIRIKELGECKADNTILEKADSLFDAVGLNPDEKGVPTNPQAGIDIGSVEYADYPLNYAVGIACMYDGDFYSISLSIDKY